MKRIVLTFGFIAGFILSVMMLVSMSLIDSIGFDRGEVLGYTTMVIAFVMTYFGIRSYRDNILGGAIRYGQAFKSGILIALIASACYVATWEVIYYTMMPDFAQKYGEHVIAKARSEGKTEAEIAKQKLQMEEFRKSYANPVVNVSYTFLEVFPIGLLIVLVSARILSWKRATAA